MRIYLDWAATAPLRPVAHAAMLAAMGQAGNPSSIHAEGQAARTILDDTRRAIGELLGVHAGWVVLTSGGTEANNLAIRGIKATHTGTVLCSGAEHDCVRKTTLAVGGEWLPVTPHGTINLQALESRLQQGGVALVSVMLANNETGVLTNVQQVAALCHRHGALCHTDAVQAVGHMPINFNDLGADMLTLSGHKLGAPLGTGALIVKPELQLSAQLTGGAQERNRRAGTENVPAIAGLGAAVTELLTTMPTEIQHAQSLADWLDAHVPAGLTMVAAGAPKVPHIRQLITSQAGSDVVIRADLHGIAISQGSACSSGTVQESPVLHAMGLGPAAARAVRLSWGTTTTLAELQQALAHLTS